MSVIITGVAGPAMFRLLSVLAVDVGTPEVVLIITCRAYHVSVSHPDLVGAFVTDGAVVDWKASATGKGMIVLSSNLIAAEVRAFVVHVSVTRMAVKGGSVDGVLAHSAREAVGLPFGISVIDVASISLFNGVLFMFVGGFYSIWMAMRVRSCGLGGDLVASGLTIVA